MEFGLPELMKLESRTLIDNVLSLVWSGYIIMINELSVSFM